MSFRQFQQPTTAIAQKHAPNTPEPLNETRTCLTKSAYEEKMFNARDFENCPVKKFEFGIKKSSIYFIFSSVCKLQAFKK